MSREYNDSGSYWDLIERPANTVQMVEKNFKDEPHLKALWESGNMMGRLSMPNEFRGATLFMLSNASSFMTGTHLVIDGGYTAW